MGTTARGARPSGVASADWIAGYAALVGTAGLLWQARTNRRDRKTKLRVELSLFLQFEEIQQLKDFGSDEPAAYADISWRVEVSALNSGARRAHLDAVNVERVPANGRGIDIWAPAAWALPWSLEADEARSVTFQDDRAGPLQVDDVLTASASTHGGQKFRSDPVVVGSHDRRYNIYMLIPEPFLRAIGIDLAGNPKVALLRLYEFPEENNKEETD